MICDIEIFENESLYVKFKPENKKDKHMFSYKVCPKKFYELIKGDRMPKHTFTDNGLVRMYITGFKLVPNKVNPYYKKDYDLIVEEGDFKDITSYDKFDWGTHCLIEEFILGGIKNQLNKTKGGD